jgi:hypothetical protein
MTLTTSSPPNVLVMEAIFDKLLSFLGISNNYYSGSCSTTAHIKHDFHGVLSITRLFLQRQFKGHRPRCPLQTSVCIPLNCLSIECHNRGEKKKKKRGIKTYHYIGTKALPPA